MKAKRIGEYARFGLVPRRKSKRTKVKKMKESKEETKLQSEQKTAEEILDKYVTWDFDMNELCDKIFILKAMEEYASQFKSQLPIEQKPNELCQIEEWMRDMNYNNMAVFWNTEDGSILRVADIIQHYIQWIKPEPLPIEGVERE